MSHNKNLVTAIGVAVAMGVMVIHSAQAQEDSVYSVNVVGFQKKELAPAGEFILTAPPFETGATNTLLSIFGTNTLKQDNNFLNCDRVMVFDPVEQVYQAWAQWTDGVFYKANNLSEWNQSIAGNPEIPRGVGYWIVAASDSEAGRTITYVGDVALSESEPVNILEGFQILAYPFSSDIALQDTSFFDDGAANNNNFLLSDRVHVYDSGTYQAYALWTDGQWYRANNLAEWNQGILATNDLFLGGGFFYEAKTNMSWNESNPYLGALND